MNTEITTNTVSTARVAANRRNAKKSTGPATAHGKAVSRLNARKHRSLAGAVLVRGRQFRESTQEFRTLCQEYHASLAPVGPVEEMLVDEIVQAAWRLRRARKAESGEIALGVDDGCEQRRDYYPVPDILIWSRALSSGSLQRKLERSQAGCSYLVYHVRKLRTAVETDGELTEEALADFKESMRHHPHIFITLLEALREKLLANPERLERAVLLEQHKEAVMRRIQYELERLYCQQDEAEKGERAEERVRQSASVLPGVTVLDRLLRYEKGLERQMYGALKQLDRLQKARRKNG
jgi:hypothetical protein